MPQTSTFANAAQPLEGLTATFQAAAEQTRTLVDASVKTWVDESRAFMGDMARDGAQALKDLQACKSPLDVINVEQKWLMARAKAYVDASVRMMAGAFSQAEEAAAENAPFHLPE